jgi:hypothetical protein
MIDTTHLGMSRVIASLLFRLYRAIRSIATLPIQGLIWYRLCDMIVLIRLVAVRGRLNSPIPRVPDDILTFAVPSLLSFSSFSIFDRYSRVRHDSWTEWDDGDRLMCKVCLVV